MAVLSVDLVAADRTVWNGEARMVTAPAADGEIGIMADHSPLLSVLRHGTIRIRPVEGEPMEVAVTGGFLSVDANSVTIVADAIEPVGESTTTAH